jgi:transcriptional regulator with XRE-family HTH domain
MIKIIGANCKKWRSTHGYYQSDTAKDTGYSLENVSAFENGRNDNCRLLSWYILKGMSLHELYKDTPYENFFPQVKEGDMNEKI